jgi:hypothetical protein
MRHDAQERGLQRAGATKVDDNAWMDVSAVEALVARLSAAGCGLESAGASAPQGGDLGLADPLIADMMASVLDAGACCAAKGIHLASGAWEEIFG